MITIIIPNIRGRSRIYWLKITIGTGEETLINPYLLTFGNFSVGNDDAENEMILFPGNFDIKFKCNTTAEYHLIINEFREAGLAEVEVRWNNESGRLRYSGSTDFISDDCEPVKKIIAFSFYDELKEFNKLYEHPVPIPPAISFFSSITTIIQNHLEVPIAVDCRTDFQITYDLFGTGEVFTTKTSYINEMLLGLKLPQSFHDYVRDGNIHYSLGSRDQVLISILNNLASIAVVENEDGPVGVGNVKVLRIYPRFNQEGNPTLINIANCYLDTIKMGVAKKFKGLRILLKTTNNEVGSNSFIQFSLGEVELEEDWSQLKYPDDVETIYLPLGLNTYDSTSGGFAYNGKYIGLGYVEYPLIREMVRVKLNGVYSAQKPLIDWVCNIIWSNLRIARKKLYCKMKGLDYDFTKTFILEGDSTIYRPIKYEYNELEDTTEMTAIECPEIEEFTLGAGY